MKLYVKNLFCFVCAPILFSGYAEAKIENIVPDSVHKGKAFEVIVSHFHIIVNVCILTNIQYYVI